MIKLTPQQTPIIMAIDENYALLQKCYTKWAANFSSHEEVIRYLDCERIKSEGIKKQLKFNLHSYHWNAITLPVTKRLEPQILVNLKQQFARLFEITKKEDYRQVWHCLFFIHPVRHELFYFDGHYPSGYALRLSKLLRSHRMGLKAAKKYLVGKSPAATEDSFIKACGTVAFKHLLLHPTTSRWQSPDVDLSKLIPTLAIGSGELFPNETTTANLLSQRGSLQFDQWLTYAPCAINEGPIFTLKSGGDLVECFNSIAELLSAKTASQLQLRQCIQTHFNVDELAKL